jgi:hypothetical protein
MSYNALEMATNVSRTSNFPMSQMNGTMKRPLTAPAIAPVVKMLVVVGAPGSSKVRVFLLAR